MANKWTEQQQQAIAAQGGDLLVAAAAGSGKTAVLVERIITRIIEEGQEIGRLLVVTFTKAAASEMRQRIGAAILTALERDPQNVHLQNQMAFLPRADIKTIHAFCLQVLREQYHLLDIDPAARTADPGEVRLLQREVLDELFETLYGEADNEWFLQLLEAVSPQTKDDRLRQLVLEAYNFAQGAPDPEALLDDAAEAYRLAPEGTVDDCRWFSLIREGAAAQAAYARVQLEKALFLLRDAGDLAVAYGERIAAERDAVRALEAVLAKEPYEVWRLAWIAVGFDRLPAYRGQEKELAERVKELRNEAKDAIKKLGETYLAYSGDFQAELIRSTAATAEALTRLTKRFLAAFAAAKRERNLIDFTDYEHLALRALLGADGKPTAAAAELRAAYDEIMIDEYQDSNIVQELLLAAVSGESTGQNNRFMVGDVKQSIYRFRQAMPELFQEKYLRYPAAAGGKERKIVLSKNFRSRKNILDGVNFICGQILCEAFGGVAYDAEAALYAGADFPPCDAPHGGANEILLVETAEQEGDDALSDELREMDRRRVEATAIAARIKALLAEGYQVFDAKSGGYRAACYGDIAILLRSMKNWGAVLEEVFGREGLPYYAETAEGYYAVPEVETVLNLLRLIDNPRQDIPLLAILHAPLYGLTAEELTLVRLGGGEGQYYDCVCRYAEAGEEEPLRARLAAFLEQLRAWRRQARDLSLHELLRLLYRETGYYDHLGMTAGGDLRQANLRLLLEKAEQYEKGSHKGLFSFLRYVEDLKTAEVEVSSAKLQNAAGNYIRVMTIHKSKGLEFPVVFVSDLGKAFNDMDARSPVIFHRTLGYGMDAVDPERRVGYRTLAKAALIDAVRLEGLTEETRVLYVALTRAKEKLILTGAVKEMEKALEKWGQAAECTTRALPLFRLRRARSYLDWIMPAYLRHPACTVCPAEWDEGQDFRFAAEDSAWTLTLLPRAEALRDTAAEQEKAAEQQAFFAEVETDAAQTAEGAAICRLLRWQYPFAAETHLPAKLSISEIKRKYQEESMGAPPADPYRSIRLPEREEKQGVRGAALGTAMHTFMEEADLRQCYDAAAIEALAAELVQRGRLTAAEAAALRRKELLGFFASPLAARLRRAERIEKEQPFSLLLSPMELYPSAPETADRVLLNGIIDCCFWEGDAVVLLDYKSDRVYDEETLAERYRLQLRLYQTALERALGLRVKEVYLYAFALGRAVRL